jgi:predicted O-methyltransferase YrrM
MINTPDVKYPERDTSLEKPSWSAFSDFINIEHEDIFSQTKMIPGWQMFGDTYKLYEMGYFAGDIILEIGTYGGRSAVVEIKGALANTRRRRPPQYFGIDLDMRAISRTYASLEQEKLHGYALLFYGDLKAFVKEFSITPTMVFVDGDHKYDGVKKDLGILSDILPPGVPVLCHDYLNPENETGEYGIRQAVTEWEDEGFAEFYNCFGCSVLMVTTDKCKGQAKTSPLSQKDFLNRRGQLLRAYFPPDEEEREKLGGRGKGFISSRFRRSRRRLRKLVKKTKNESLKTQRIFKQILESMTGQDHQYTIYHFFPNHDKSRNPKRFSDIRDPIFWEVYERCRSYSLVSIESFYNIFRSVEYIAKNKIAGDFVECGVFLGGAVMAMALFAKHFGISDRKFYLYDTFAGFPEGVTEVNFEGKKLEFLKHPEFLPTVQKNISMTGLEEDKFIINKGPVEETLRQTIPQSICFLRLDTDYYKSTQIELQVLYPLLVPGGVLVIDDYGYIEGVRNATDEYFSSKDSGILLHRTDFTGRVLVKPGFVPSEKP